ncbi:MFS transporter [Sediminibacillus halophilus]|uniref:Predicted arabinose efflux permease, MFS family n=1 Tax=Sediminibacillus halophilus TaxID=482461 RepID=A0A1G9R3S7_9BACI|nr:MFS transporter [Sediminibacillus halophilus]SDM17956.1 Predicted arabinose efflux permease, MFS family [Sediminibacillus halophilus]
MDEKKLIIVGLPMIAVTYGLSRFSYGLMLPYISESIKMEQYTSGVISSFSYIAYCIAIIVAMVFSNKISPKAILFLAGLLSIIGLGIISIAANPAVLGLGIFLAGLSTGFSSPPYATIVDLNVERSLQNQTNSWINSGTSIGTALTGSIAIIMTDSWRETYLIFMVIAIIVLFANYKVLPKNQSIKENGTFGFSKEEWRRAVPLIVASMLLGISCSAYWTFSRDFILQAENIPDYIGKWLWVVIGISGLLGGTAGAVINKHGLATAYRISVLALSTSSLLLGRFADNSMIGFLSPALFGSSYIFMTGVLIAWGISVFKLNPSFGLGIPFLILALGQAIGSVFSGVFADLLGYPAIFIGGSLIGYAALFFKKSTIS